MHDYLLDHQEHLKPDDLLRYANELGLDVNRFREDLNRQAHRTRVAQDIESADISGATGTPTFFINGQRHYGAYDQESLKAAISTARTQLHAAKSAARMRRSANPGGPT
jgi:predicted DsbA family dithiol-disulfide isomerase